MRGYFILPHPVHYTAG